MSPPTPTPPTPTPPSTSGSASSAAPPPQQPPPSEVPLTGFRSALEHTGLPRSVLTYKPRLPSRNWTIFLSLVAGVTYAYTYDRRECERIKAEYIAKVEGKAKEPMKGSFEMPRKVTVLASRWPEDDDLERGVKYFKRYVKPYLVAAAIDYEPLSSPLYGSTTRQIHAQILAKRRQRLGLEPVPISISLLSPEQIEQRELEGGIIIVGRATMKEYLAGLKRGWTGGVGEWKWEDDVEKRLENDGVFQSPQEEELVPAIIDEPPATSEIQAPTPTSTSSSIFSFLSRPRAATPSSLPTTASSSEQQQQSTIPPDLHIPPSPLPPSPPILLLPFTNHMGFLQIPWMLYDFFNERQHVRSGAESALKLIQGETRPLAENVDLEFDKQAEAWYKKSFSKFPQRIQQARKDYLAALEPKIEDARKYANGEREMTDAEKNAGKVVTELELKQERKAKELRWMGNEEGYEIVKPETDPAWSDIFNGWLKVYDDPSNDVPSNLR
ncbi:inner membrane protein import complex subunit Tim54-domain-containing protein [Naematelia encephala]|uniref:Mitochondrial import inner membrane translocase subunit TIM54 n=1 Tax=Naematelia encephala TaxID=71784 RepID=A0A1Y2AXQ1_9TREE|nr:inner membrane protein import complex subunit Tim54-domain-containing protein [Naematelia encephala]